MKHFFFGFFMISMICQGQVGNSVILDTFFNNYCPGTKVDVSFKTTGIFNDNNEFIIEISDQNGLNFKELERTNLTFSSITIPESTQYGESYRIRVKATSPKIEGNLSNKFTIKSKPNAIISYEANSPKNPFSTINLNCKITGGSPYDITLNDSSNYTFHDFPKYESNFSTIKLVEKDFIYKIVELKNRCGTGTFSGEANVKSNPFGLIIKNLKDLYYACPGQRLTYFYSTNGTLTDNNIFKLRLKSTTENYQKNLEVIETKEGYLESVLPADLESSKSYTIQLISSSPETYSDLMTFRVPSKASVGNIYNGFSQYGNTPSLRINLMDGVPPYQVSLSNGQTHYLTKENSEIPLIDFNQKDAQLTIKDQCNTIDNNFDRINVSLPSFISIDSIPTRSYCVGDLLEIPITSNLNITSNTKFYFSLWGATVAHRPKFEATLIDNKLSAIIPPMHGDYYTVMISSESPDSDNIAFNRRIKINQAAKASISINKSPLYTWLELNPGDSFEPTHIKLDINGKEHLLNSTDFTYKLLKYRLNINTQKSQTFTLKELKNECGTAVINSVSKTATNTINNPQNRHLIIGGLPKSNYCVNEQVRVPFELEGDLNENEVIELYRTTEWDDFFIKLSESRTSPVTYTIPSNQSLANLKVFLKISNSEIKSDERGLELMTKPAVYFENIRTEVFKNEPVALSIKHSGSVPLEYIFNGQKRIINSNSSSDINSVEFIHFYPKQDTTYKIESVKNVCGNMEIIAKTEASFKVSTSKIFFDNYNTQINSRACLGEIVRIPYKASYMRSDTKVFVELTDHEGLNFVKISTINETNTLLVTIPKNLKGSNKYKIRMVAQNLSDTYYSEERTFTILEPATGNISSKEGTDLIESNGKEEIPLALKFTGSPTYKTIISNFYNQTYNLDPTFNFGDYPQPSIINVRPLNKTEYFISQLTNECGYGQVTGSVTVAVRPFTEVIKLGSTSVCKNEKTTLDIELLGDYIDDDLVLVKLYQFISEKLEVVKELARFKAKDNGTIELEFSDEINAGQYFISADFEKNILNDVSLSSYNRITVKDPARIEMSGNAVINGGNSVFVNVLVAGTVPISYELSDGKKGTLYRTGTSTISVNPTSNTSYTIKSASNDCGVALSSGVAVVEVNEFSSKRIDLLPLSNIEFCSSESISLPFNIIGDFSTENAFIAQISDETGSNFANILNATSSQSPITFSLPNDLTPGKDYRFRIISTDNDSKSNTSPNPIRILQGIKLKVTGSAFYIPNEAIKIQVESLGATNFNLNIRDSLTGRHIVNKYITSPSFNFNLYPTEPTIYKFSTRNRCGLASFHGPDFLEVNVLLAKIEQAKKLIQVYPNPATRQIRIKSSENINFEDISIFNNIGVRFHLFPTTINFNELEYDVSHLKPGVYIFKVRILDEFLSHKFVVNN